MDTRRRTGTLAAIIVLGALIQCGIILALIVALVGSAAPRIPERIFGDSPKASNEEAKSVEDAKSVAQLFLRLVADQKFNVACTQVMPSGMVNPCMADLDSRNLVSIEQAGSSIVVLDAHETQDTATVLGKDTRPAIEKPFVLRLKRVDQRWLVHSVDETPIVGSP